MIAGRRGLERQIMLVFAGFTLAVTALFALYAIGFVYTVEDHFLTAQMDEEAAYLKTTHAKTGTWTSPRNQRMRVYTDREKMPDVVRQGLGSATSIDEFAGEDGRRFHLVRLSPDGARPQAWLLYDVSKRLGVRPIRTQILIVLSWSTIVALIASLAIGGWLARRISAPLARLADAVAAMQPNDLPERLPTRVSNDEVGVLARGLEQLIRRIREFIAREQEFTRDASHELRTPLTVIRIASERLAAEPALSESARLHLDHVRHSSTQLEQTVATLLALAREQTLDKGEEQTRLLPLIERAIIEQSPLIGERAITVEVELPAEFAFDRPAGVLHILLSNLIGNAFAHTERGEVRVDTDGQILRISNHGLAIDPRLRTQLHKPFRKREGSAGFGLGLAIVQRLCDRYAIDMRIDHNESGTVASLACRNPA
jgi:signal transduction histidine kinase